jgi:uncharacterized protein (DUF433 family)
MSWKKHIVADPQILVGKPTIQGTRISVEHVLDCLANGWGFDELIINYPHLNRDQVLSAIAFAAEVFREHSAAAIEKLTLARASTQE